MERLYVKQGFRGWLLKKWMIYDRMNEIGPFGYWNTEQDAIHHLNLNYSSYLSVRN